MSTVIEDAIDLAKRTGPISAAELRRTTPPAPDWLIENVIAKGWGVIIGGRPKVGKGALGMYLLGKLERGEAHVLRQSAGSAHRADRDRRAEGHNQ